MSSIFNADGPVFRFLTRVSDLMILNVFFILTSIPIVTIGASAAALNTVCGRMTRGEDTYIAKGYFAAFRDNLRQGILLTLLYLVMGALIFFDFRILVENAEGFPPVLRYMLYAITAYILMTMPVTFALQARFRNTLKNTLKNSALVTMLHFLRAFVSILLWSLPIILAVVDPYYFLMLSIVWILIGFSLTSLAVMRIFRKVFAQLEGGNAENKENGALTADSGEEDLDGNGE